MSAPPGTESVRAPGLPPLPDITAVELRAAVKQERQAAHLKRQREAHDAATKRKRARQQQQQVISEMAAKTAAEKAAEKAERKRQHELNVERGRKKRAEKAERQRQHQEMLAKHRAEKAEKKEQAQARQRERDAKAKAEALQRRSAVQKRSVLASFDMSHILEHFKTQLEQFGEIEAVKPAGMSTMGVTVIFKEEADAVKAAASAELKVTELTAQVKPARIDSKCIYFPVTEALRTSRKECQGTDMPSFQTQCSEVFGAFGSVVRVAAGPRYITVTFEQEESAARAIQELKDRPGEHLLCKLPVEGATQGVPKNRQAPWPKRNKKSK